jgi:hypothetical protein
MAFKSMSRFGAGRLQLGLLALLSLSGCSDGLPKLPTVPAQGTVTYNGTALEGAQVAFISTTPDTGKSANAVTDSQGHFELHTYLGGANQASGAIPGDYVVTIEKWEGQMAGATDPASAMQSMVMSGDPTKKASGTGLPQPKLLTPEKYADAAKPEFKATVKPSGDNSFTFEMVD